MDATTVESIALISSSSNTNTLSCGSSSSSIASSGYASSTTTPPNPSSVGGSSNRSQYSDSHSTTPVGMVEPTTASVPTVAAITPYYNENFQHPQQQQVQHQQRQPTLPQNPHSHTTQQQYQQQQTHSYQLTEQQQSPTLSQYSNNSSTSAYDTMYPYLGSSSGESYTTPQSTEGERNLLGMRHTTAFYTTTAADKPNKLPHTQNVGTQPLSHAANNTYIPNNNNKLYNSSESSLSAQKRSGADSSSPAAKPQAAATPFYAQSTNPTAASYLDPYKNSANKLPSHKLSSHSIDFTNYGNPTVLDASPYAQNFTPYHGGKILQDISYSKPLTNARMSQQRLGGNIHYGNSASMPSVSVGASTSNSSNHGNGAYLDKYVYTAVSAAPTSSYYASTAPTSNLSGIPYNTYGAAPAPATPTYAADISNDAYRKPAASAASSWHWSVDYPNGNCRSLPPPASATAAPATHNGLPTAAIPPTSASFIPSSNLTGPASRDIYYTTDKYNSNKYDKYNTYYNPHQPYPTGRNVWQSATHGSTHLVPTAQFAERLPPHPHHTYAHHSAAPHPSSGAASTHPSFAYQHTYPASSTGARQNCCSQTFQPQNGYYPRAAHYPPPGPYFANTYNPHTAQAVQYSRTGAAAVGRSSNNNATGKYSMLDYGHASKSKANTNDLYASSGTAAFTPPTYDAAGLNYHRSYPTAVKSSSLPPHNQQQYLNAESMLNANITTGPDSDLSTAYYNDLSMQPTYENYLSPMQAPALIQQRRQSLVQRVEHLPNISIPYMKQPQTPMTGSMVDYQKGATTATINDDCFMASGGGTTLTNLDEHMATTNMNNSYESSAFGGMHLSHGVESSEKTDIPTTSTAKTYSSLRDFLSTWNEDEDDCAAELKFVEAETQQMVVEQQVGSTKATISHNEIIASNVAEQTHTVGTHPSQIIYDQETSAAYQTQSQRLPSGDQAQLKENTKKHVEYPINMTTNNNVPKPNLPDIIIDIKKSGSTLSNAPRTSVEKSDTKIALYDSFDVEKELDELEIKKIKLTKTNLDTPFIRTGSVIKKIEAQVAPKFQEKSNENIHAVEVLKNSTAEMECLKTLHDFEYVDIKTSYQPVAKVKNVEEREHQTLTSAVQAKPDSTYDRGIESENTTSSNGSSFEKAYESFINKIGNELDVKVTNRKESDIETPDISSDVPQSIEKETATHEKPLLIKQNSDSDLEIAQKIKSYSKFYKRKRTYSESNIDKESNKKFIAEQNNGPNINSNFPLIYTKHSRKRECVGLLLKIRLKSMHWRHSKSYAYCRRRMRTLRRYDAIKWKQIYIKALLKQYTSVENEKTLQIGAGKDKKTSEQTYNPRSLKCLSVSFINSDIFRRKFLKAGDLKNEDMEKKNLLKNVGKNVESVNGSKEKENIEILQNEIIQNPSSVKRPAQASNEKEDLDVTSSNTIQPDIVQVCKKLKLASDSAVCSQVIANDVNNKNEFTTDNKSDCIESENVIMKDNERETVIQNEKRGFDLSATKTEMFIPDTPLLLAEQQPEISPTREAKHDIENDVILSDIKTNSTEQDVPENMSNEKKYDESMEIQFTCKNAVQTKSTIENEAQLSTTNASEYNENTVTQEESQASNAAVKDAPELTNELNNTPKNAEEVQIIFREEEELQNPQQEEENLNFIENNECKVLKQHTAEDNLTGDIACSNNEDREYKTMHLTTSAKYEQSAVNDSEESVGGFSEHELETISLHLRAYSNQSNAESELVCFTSPPNNEITSSSNVERDNDIDETKDILKRAILRVDDETEPTATEQSKDGDLVLSEMDNSSELDNSNEESKFTEHELDTIALYLRCSSNQSNSESKLEGFSSSPKGEEVTSSNIEKDDFNEESKNIQEKATPRADDETELTTKEKTYDIDLDLSETENSVDMFGARKCAEYFTAASKKYFQDSTDDESSTDSSFSCSSSQSSSSSDCKLASSSSSIITITDSSTDEETQSSAITIHSDSSEMKELQRELSPHQILEMNSLWTETEEEQNTEEAAAACKVTHKNRNDVRLEIDIKTMKEILERDSDGRKEVNLALEKSNDKVKQDEKMSACIDTESLKHNQINAVITIAHDNKEPNVNNNEELPTSLTQRCDIVAPDSVDQVLTANDDAKIENADNRMSVTERVEENHSTPITHLPTTQTPNTSDGAVLSLRNIALNFLERENSIVNQSTQIMCNRTEEDALNISNIPKLSDLCKNALSSSFELSSVTTNITNQNNAPEKLEHELSVEEALAEMYRQVGVTSDVDDGDDDEDANEVKEAQDVVLINLEEILVNDSDLYVLQCDMNENVLSVVAHAQSNNLPSMIINEDIDNNQIEDRCIQQVVEMTNNAITTTDSLGPFMGAVDEDSHSLTQTENETEAISTYAHSQTHTLEFVDDALNSQFEDFPAIHHEEIVSQDAKRYKRQLLYNSLREKYVLKRMHFKIQHGNRVLKKYINRWILQCLIARFRERELRKVQKLFMKD